ncbi:FadR/GntR family transcriptional regulator [Marinimicrobium alkaliphilum]|uniref:FadR/GntR family transcriptional regulator n=1 Tax=Marinimicrobium alkaliphilum TaxID=2202654 RepID=UPI000DB96A8E|nr:FadR/GntR family transcriptional regulator [Marinimicrobium alkaliphilum]
MELKAIKTDRLYVKVAGQLSRLISDGHLKPGERFPSERELAERLGVSRPTIREAMIALELSGLIEIRTGSGIYVLSAKPARLQLRDRGVGPFQVLEARLLVEPEACALAAVRITEEQLLRLSAAYQAMEAEDKKGSVTEAADWSFHGIIAEASQNSAVHEMVDWLWELRSRSELSTAFMSRIRDEGVRPALEEHKAIVQALVQRDPEAARAAMREHLENAIKAAASHFGDVWPASS